jgi:hypothetical protein
MRVLPGGLDASRLSGGPLIPNGVYQQSLDQLPRLPQKESTSQRRMTSFHGQNVTRLLATTHFKFGTLTASTYETNSAGFGHVGL